jgi:hypothetical protein
MLPALSSQVIAQKYATMAWDSQATSLLNIPQSGAFERWFFKGMPL